MDALNELQEQAANLRSELDGFNLSDDATVLSEEQSTRVSELIEQIDSVDKQIEQLTQRAEVRKRALDLLQVNKVEQPTQAPAEVATRQEVVIPARAKARYGLKAFENERDAFIAGHHIAAHLFDSRASQQWLDDHGMRTALSITNDQKGGVVVPTEMENAIVRLVEEYGVFRRYANVSPMAGDTKIVPVRTGGMTAYAVGESTESTSSNTGTATSPTYKPVELVARKWKAWCKMSEELNEDMVIDLAEQVSIEIAQAFAYAEDNAGFNGDGTSTYNGIVGIGEALAAGSIYTMGTGDQAFSDITLADLESVVGKAANYPGFMPAWFISKAGYYASMDNLKNAAGGNTSRDLEALNLPIFMGYPVVWSQAMTSTLTDQASTILAYFGDLRMACVFGDRRGITLSTSDQRYWDEDQIAIKGTERIDIVTHSTGTATAGGAVIALKTNAS